MNPVGNPRVKRAAQVAMLLALLGIGALMWTEVAADWRKQEQHDVRRTNAEHGVVVFVTEWCGYCKRLQAWLDASGVPYRALDVEKSEAAAYGQRAAVGRHAGVPTIVIGTDVFQGLQGDELRERLERGGFTMRGDP
ncbi:MAG TPA: glutaredoxin family protein [Candidatus Saccharimonadia bacterium]|nr:glutaredoxin family protein [Candidatus Saccharimonadia bacterium]